MWLGQHTLLERKHDVIAELSVDGFDLFETQRVEFVRDRVSAGTQFRSLGHIARVLSLELRKLVDDGLHRRNGLP